MILQLQQAEKRRVDDVWSEIRRKQSSDAGTRGYINIYIYIYMYIYVYIFQVYIFI
jgi:hypothetical protein